MEAGNSISSNYVDVMKSLDLDKNEVYNLIRQAHPAAYENLMEKAAFEADRSKPKAEKIYELIRGKAETL